MNSILMVGHYSHKHDSWTFRQNNATLWDAENVTSIKSTTIVWSNIQYYLSISCTLKSKNTIQNNWWPQQPIPQYTLFREPSSLFSFSTISFQVRTMWWCLRDFNRFILQATFTVHVHSFLENKKILEKIDLMQ